MRSTSSKIGQLIAVLLFAGAGCAQLQASIYSLTGPEQLFVSLSENLVLNGGTLYGDAGIVSSLDVEPPAFVLADAPYTGTAYFAGAVNCSGGGCPGNLAGGTVANSATVTAAINDYNNLITTLEGLSGATQLGNFNGGTLSPGLYQVGTLTLTDANTSSLTLDAGGNPNAQFVIRVDKFSIGGTGSIYLTNGAQPDNVIILEDQSNPIIWDSTGTFSGILLDGDSANGDKFEFTHLGPQSVGRVIYPVGTVTFDLGDGVVFASGASVTSIAPEPFTFGLVGLGLAILVFKSKSRKISLH